MQWGIEIATTAGARLSNCSNGGDAEIHSQMDYLKLGGSAAERYPFRVKLLFIADIVGQPGRRAVKELLPKLRKEHDVQLVVANGENAAGGSGITVNTSQEIFAAGVDIMTSGDHLWDQKEVTELLESERRFVRPLNYPAGTSGQGSTVWQIEGQRPVAILNLQGRTFMPPLENPFSCAQEAVKNLRKQTNLIFVDFHAEATSEKVALARMLDGRVSAVIGTHTHVQTADEQIFPGGTAYLTDGGFTGPHESVIGREIEPIVRRFLTNLPQKFEVARGRVLLQGAVVEIDDATGRAIKIARISEPLAS
jgi:metallophosphoesterase (TIGR00282 family)